MTEEKMSQILRQGENEVLIARKARWDEQLQGLVELERRCLTLREEVDHLNERQEVMADLMVSKKDMQKTAPEKEKIFEESKERAEQRTTEALALVQKKHKLIKCEAEGSCKGWRRQCTRSMVRRPRHFILWFLLIFPGPPPRRSNVCCLQDGKRCR